MLRCDGEYKFYIIKHRYKKKSEWADSGDCCQWLPNTTYNENVSAKKKYDIFFRPFSASGSCWQETGVHGSYHKLDALKILNIITDLNPNRRFAVFVVNIKQSTDFIAQMIPEEMPVSLKGLAAHL